METPTTVTSASATIEPGRLVGGRYRLLARLGRGGAGSVWRAHDELLHRDVAVKRLHGGRGLDAVRSQTTRERDEGRLLGRLDHPRLAAIYDLTELDGEVCLVMEYVAAPSLADLLHREGPLPAARVAAIGAQIADGLAAMHHCGVVHRDVKPSNIMVGSDDTVTITDFGVAGLGDDALGTPHLVAPELAGGNVPTAAADMFSLGATLHAMLEGGPPGRQRRDGEALDVLTRGTAGVGRLAGDAERLRPVLRALLDHDPQRRPSAAAVVGLLGEYSATAGVAGAHAAAGRSAAAEYSGPSGTANLKGPTPGGQDTAPTGPLTAAWATVDQMDDRSAVIPERRTAPAHGGGRHRAVLVSRRRPSRRAVAVGAGLAGVLGVVAIVAQPTGADLPPAASPVLGPAAAPPLPPKEPPITSATASTVTATPVEQVASGAPSRSPRSRPAAVEASSSNRPDLDEALGDEALGDEARGDDGVFEAGDDGGDDGKDGKDEAPGKGHGNGRGRGG
jgi:eukaryotic-like serine/threonine-protein kinase